MRLRRALLLISLIGCFSWEVHGTSSPISQPLEAQASISAPQNSALHPIAVDPNTLLEVHEQVIEGQPKPWQLHFQEARSPVMKRVTRMHDTLLWVMGGVAFLVAFLLSFVVFRFRASRNPTPSQTAHNTTLEILWTLVPTLFIFSLMVPTIRLLRFMEIEPEAEVTIKATGHQWYWSYEYPDLGEIGFDSNMIEDKDLKPGQLRLLTTDNPLVVPVGKVINLQTTSMDVIHSFAVPSLGVKRDCIPGRLNQVWFKIEKPGVYYGQCSELCGARHAFMPIMVIALKEPEFEAWIKAAQSRWGKGPRSPVPSSSGVSPT